MASRKRRPGKFPIYRDGKVHVCKTMCSSCIFRKDGKAAVDPERTAQMALDTTADEGAIPCHHTIYGENGGRQAMCRGFFNLKSTIAVRMAIALGMVEFVEIDDHRTADHKNEPAK